MHQSGYKSILRKMNISSDVIIINQADSFGYEKAKYGKKNVLFLSLPERGVGLSRNNALMRCTSEIALFADDDVMYAPKYEDTILAEFRQHPKADIIIFNVASTNPDRPEYSTKKFKRVRLYNCLRYGTIRIAVRAERIKEKNIHFSLLFGGGAKYSAGEDSLFIAECIRKGLRIYASPINLGSVDHKTSTWFEGYTEKFFTDKGVFFKHFSPTFSKLMILQYAVRKNKIYGHEKSFREALQIMNKGLK